MDDFDIFELARKEDESDATVSVTGPAEGDADATLEIIILEDIASHARNVNRALQDYLDERYGFDADLSHDQHLPDYEIERVRHIRISTYSDGVSLLRRFGDWNSVSREFARVKPGLQKALRYGVFDQRLGGEGGLTGVETLKILRENDLILGGVVLSGYADPNQDIIPSVGLADRYLRKELFFGGTEEMRNLFVQQVALMATQCVLRRHGQIEAEKRKHLLHTVPDLIIALIYQKDLITGVHSETVRDITQYLGRQLGLDDNELLVLSFAAAIHDTGKIGVPTGILNKSPDLEQTELDFVVGVKETILKLSAENGILEPVTAVLKNLMSSDDFDRSVAEQIKMRGRLTAEERMIICTHPLHSAIIRDRYLSAIRERIEDSEILNYIEQIFSGIDHHEHLDGSGYPQGSQEQDISLYAQIIQVADIYEALTCNYRTYKKAYPHETSIEILRTLAEDGKINARIVDILEDLPESEQDALNQSRIERLEEWKQTQRRYWSTFEKSPHFKNLLKNVKNSSLLEEYGIQLLESLSND